MKNLSTATILGLALLTPLGCSDDTPSDTTNDPNQTGSHPQLTEWETVVDKLAFPTSGDGKIDRLTVGRKEYNMNFANRGDIEVMFDQTTDVITIEMRKYDFSDNLTAKGDGTEDNEGTFNRMELWAYNMNGSAPTKPTAADRADPAKNCTLGTWKNGCSVYVYYDGQSQPVRSGVDLRVHLPIAWRGELNVQTEDNDGEASYPRRSNITISGEGDAGWCGSGSVKMSSGVAEIRLCRNLEVAPTCAANEACANYIDPVTMEPAAWDMACGCSPMQYGQMRIEAVAPWAADITVDAPDGLWLNANVANMGPKPNDCTATLDSCTGSKCTLNNDEPQLKSGEFNYPGGAAAPGAGFNLTVQSAGCGDFDFFAEPDDWAADATPKVELRGDVKVCTGCL